MTMDLGFFLFEVAVLAVALIVLTAVMIFVWAGRQ